MRRTSRVPRSEFATGTGRSRRGTTRPSSAPNFQRWRPSARAAHGQPWRRRARRRGPRGRPVARERQPVPERRARRKDHRRAAGTNAGRCQSCHPVPALPGRLGLDEGGGPSRVQRRGGEANACHGERRRRCVLAPTHRSGESCLPRLWSVPRVATEVDHVTTFDLLEDPCPTNATGDPCPVERVTVDPCRGLVASAGSHELMLTEQL